MGKIGYGYGSEWHLLRYLGYHRQWFSDFVAQEIGCNRVSWLDFGFTGVNQPIRQDGEIKGLEFIPDPLVQQQWKQFWPANAQHWDAVGIANYKSHNALLLVEEMSAP